MSLLQIKISWNKGYDVIISVHDVTSKILSRDSSYIVNVVMWPKFVDYCISPREVIKISILWGFDQKNYFFEGWPWFKFNNLRLALGMTSKCYTNVAKGLKLIDRMFVEVAGEKLIEGAFLSPHTFWIELTVLTYPSIFNSTGVTLEREERRY